MAEVIVVIAADSEGSGRTLAGVGTEAAFFPAPVTLNPAAATPSKPLCAGGTDDLRCGDRHPFGRAGVTPIATVHAEVHGLAFQPLARFDLQIRGISQHSASFSSRELS